MYWDLNFGLGNVLARIGLAVLFGALIGLERQKRHKSVGVRTLVLVSLGACLFLIGVEEIAASTPGAARLPFVVPAAAAVIGGIGFLGAGAIVRNTARVEGVTTAAAIWVTAGVGVACGVGEFALALLCGGAALATLTLVRLVEWIRPPSPGIDDEPDAS